VNGFQSASHVAFECVAACAVWAAVSAGAFERTRARTNPPCDVRDPRGGLHHAARWRARPGDTLTVVQGDVRAFVLLSPPCRAFGACRVIGGPPAVEVDDESFRSTPGNRPSATQTPALPQRLP